MRCHLVLSFITWNCHSVFSNSNGVPMEMPINSTLSGMVGDDSLTRLSLKGANFLNRMRSLPLKLQFRAIQGDLKLRQASPDPKASQNSMRSVGIMTSSSGSRWNSLMTPAPQHERQMAEPAFCATESSTVALDIPDRDPHAFYYPSCVRVKRCNGCCFHDLLSCQPEEVENITVTIMKADQRTQEIEYLSIPVEQHKKCTCSCTVKEQDCFPSQVYKKSDCRCACSNSEVEKLECLSAPNRIWNPQLCFCQCLRMHECTTGHIFDPTTCMCRDQHQRLH